MQSHSEDTEDRTWKMQNETMLKSKYLNLSLVNPVYGHHPSLEDIPPVASHQIPTKKVHPMEGLPLEKHQLHAAASDALEHGQSPYAGPRFYSLYDMSIPHTLYDDTRKALDTYRDSFFGP